MHHTAVKELHLITASLAASTSFGNYFASGTSDQNIWQSKIRGVRTRAGKSWFLIYHMFFHPVYPAPCSWNMTQLFLELILPYRLRTVVCNPSYTWSQHFVSLVWVVRSEIYPPFHLQFGGTLRTALTPALPIPLEKPFETGDESLSLGQRYGIWCTGSFHVSE